MTEASQNQPPENSEDALGEFFEECRSISELIENLGERLANLGHGFDIFGDASSCKEGSAARRAAELRDHADMCLSQAVRHLQTLMRVRAESSRSVDLLVESIVTARGDGSDCIKLIKEFHERTGDDNEGLGKIDDETFLSSFFADLYQRVEAMPALAARYPEHLRFAAKRFQGLPMLVSHHIDNVEEFRRLAEVLGLGEWHPLDVSPRRKRGGSTPAMSYLEPLVCRLDDFRDIMLWIASREAGPFTSERIANAWETRVFEEKPPAAVVEVLRKVPSLPRLTKSTALAWSKEVIVPYILVTDGADPASSKEHFLSNIWAHRSVKSIPTFRSRLESAVTDFLTRYSRAE